MKIKLALISLLSLAVLILTGAQSGVMSAIVGKLAVAATPITCDNSTTHNGNDGGGDGNVIQDNFCTMGNNAAGYATPVLHAWLTGGSGHLQLGLYTSKTSGCAGSQTKCASTKVCTTASTVVTGIAQQYDITPSSCGTLTASAVYWIAIELDDAASAIGTNTSGTGSGAFDAATTYGTFPTSYPNTSAPAPRTQLWLTATAN